MYSQIRTAIVNLLTNSGLFQQVYPYEPAVLESYPCVTVSATSSQSSDLATGTIMGPTQLDTYTFTLRIYYGLTQPGVQADNQARQVAVDTILAKTDALIDLLGANRSLGGACQKTRPTTTRIYETQREMVVMCAEVTLEVEVVVKRV